MKWCFKRYCTLLGLEKKSQYRFEKLNLTTLLEREEIIIFEVVNSFWVA